MTSTAHYNPKQQSVSGPGYLKYLDSLFLVSGTLVIGCFGRNNCVVDVILAVLGGEGGVGAEMHNVKERHQDVPPEDGGHLETAGGSDEGEKQGQLLRIYTELYNKYLQVKVPL